MPQIVSSKTFTAILERNYRRQLIEAQLTLARRYASRLNTEARASLVRSRNHVSEMVRTAPAYLRRSRADRESFLDAAAVIYHTMQKQEDREDVERCRSRFDRALREYFNG